MKKMTYIINIVCIILISIPFYFQVNQVQSEPVQSESEVQVIPDEAIRLRILANSDSEKDQQLKRLVRDEVNAEITKWVEDLTSIEAARALIKSRTSDIQAMIEKVLRKENNMQEVQVEYGKNVSFPVKLYGSFLYPAGEYEAVLITLGEGKGSNWWCVLFPPLCFLDFSNGTTVAEGDLEHRNEKNEEIMSEVEEEPPVEDEVVEKEAEVDHEKENVSEDDEIEVKFFLFEWLDWT